MIFLVDALKNDPACRIAWPTLERQQQYGEAIHFYGGGKEHFGEAVRVIGYLDGTRKQTEDTFLYCNFFLENAHYNRHTHTTCTNNVFVSGPDGRIFWSMSNLPGSWHDAGVAMTMPFVGLAYFTHKMKPHKHRLIADSGFIGSSVTRDLAECLPCVPKDGAPPSRQSKRMPRGVSSAVLRTFRQPCEWMNKGLNDSCPRLRMRGRPTLGRWPGLFLGVLRVIFAATSRAPGRGGCATAAGFAPRHAG